MKEGKASWMAEVMAIHRTIESMRPANARVCYDPYAVKFLGTRFRILAKSPSIARIVHWYFAERRIPGGYGEIVARTRYIDDYMLECLADGVKQIVILGAGYDSRAYRFDGVRKGVKVFEVDHPDTQKLKIEKVKKILGGVPDHVVYVAVDLSREKLGEKLFESGYQRSLKTLFIWEGVTMYITEEAVDDTMAFVVENSGEGSSIIFDYILKSVVDKSCELEIANKWKEYLARSGEQATFGIAEGELEDRLVRRGFCRIESVDDEFVRKYFTEVNRKQATLPFFRFAHATVGPPKRDS